jgi:Ca2+-binding EF-hand superfamily protein
VNFHAQFTQACDGVILVLLMVGMLNFTHTDKEKRVHFMFKIFDTDHNGFLTEDELINILAASHMVGFLSQACRSNFECSATDHRTSCIEKGQNDNEASRQRWK